VIISHSNRFIFFKPIKVAGTSIEAALWSDCDKDVDLYTGAKLISEARDSKIDLLPRNNWSGEKVLNIADSKKYLKKHGQNDLLKKLENQDKIKQLRIVDPIFYEHTSPKMFSETEYSIPVDHYRTVSVVRNPFDMLVSYYWWSFNVEESISPAFNEKYTKNKRKLSNLCPRHDDDIDLLRDKMLNFYNLPANYSMSYRQPDSQITVLEWLAQWQNEFFLSDIDYWIKFEDIKNTFHSACQEMNINCPTLPRFKIGIRKSEIHFVDYFNKSLIMSVNRLFSKVIERFNY